MLEGLYTCLAASGDDTRLEAEVRLDAAHPIFAGHFPGRAVLPGVCQLQMVLELTRRHLQRPLRCRAIRELKFLDPVLPPQDAVLRIVLVLTRSDDGSVGVQGIIGSGGVQKTKIKATFAE